MSITEKVIKTYLASKFGSDGAESLLEQGRQMIDMVSQAANPVFADRREEQLCQALNAAPPVIAGVERLGMIALRMPTPQKKGLLLVLNNEVAEDPIIAKTLARWGEWEIASLK